jgi:hypothetical protein
MVLRIEIRCSTHKELPVTDSFHCLYNRQPNPQSFSHTPDIFTNPNYHYSYYAPSFTTHTNSFSNRPIPNYEDAKRKSMEFALKLSRVGYVRADGTPMNDEEIARQKKFEEEQLNRFPGKNQHEKQLNAMNSLADKMREISKKQSSKHSPREMPEDHPLHPKNMHHKQESPPASLAESFNAKIKKIIKEAFIKKTETLFDKLINKQPLTPDEIKFGMDKARVYYKFINLHNSFKYKYGKIALDVLDKRTPFGEVANIHLETTAKRHGFDQAAIERIMQEYPIYLAMRDARMRLDANFDPQQEARNIANYHYDGLKELYKLPLEAWGGALFEEFGGSGLWMHLDDANEIDVMKVMNNIIRAVAEDAHHNGVSARVALSYLWQTQIAAFNAMPELEDIPMRYGLPIADLIEGKGMHNFLIQNPVAQSFWALFLGAIQKELGFTSFKQVVHAQNNVQETTELKQFLDELDISSTEESSAELYTPPGHYTDEE